MNHFRHIFLILLFWKEDLTKLTRILFSLEKGWQISLNLVLLVLFFYDLIC